MDTAASLQVNAVMVIYSLCEARGTVEAEIVWRSICATVSLHIYNIFVFLFRVLLYPNTVYGREKPLPAISSVIDHLYGNK